MANAASGGKGDVYTGVTNAGVELACRRRRPPVSAKGWAGWVIPLKDYIKYFFITSLAPVDRLELLKVIGCAIDGSIINYSFKSGGENSLPVTADSQKG